MIRTYVLKFPMIRTYVLRYKTLKKDPFYLAIYTHICTYYAIISVTQTAMEAKANVKL